MSIGSLSARILLDASGVQSGMSLTRAEMRLTRQAFMDSATDAEKLETALRTLESARDKGAFRDEESYARAVAAVRAELDPAVKAEQDLAAARAAAAQRGQALADGLMTAEERRAARLNEANSLLAEGAISQETYNRALRQMETERFDELNDGINRSMQGLEKAAGSLAVFGAAATAAFGSAAYAALDSAAQYEQTTIAFGTLLGSAEAAEQTLGRLSQFAASTPFQMPQIEQVARGLIMFGETGDQMMGTLKILGDVASGTGANFGEIGSIFNQVRGAGKLLTQDFRQLATRGVISLQDLATYYGVTTEAAGQMISAGKVSFEDLRSILAGLTTEGGRFADMMLQQSASATGLSSTLADNLGLALRGIGQDLLPIQKSFTQLGISAVSAFTEMDPALRSVVSGTIGLGAALGGTATALTGGVFAATKLYTAYTTMTATLTTLSTATAGATAATVAQTAASYAATIALKGLTVAKYAAAGAGAALAAAAALYVGYNVGQTLYGWTEAGQTAARVMDDLRASMESITTLDFAGTAREDLETYIASTERQIAKIQEHNAELQAGQAWWNFWQRNSDLIGQNEAQVQTLQDALERARTELNAGQTAPAVQNQAAIDAVDQYTAKMREQIATAGMTADAVDLWRLRQEGATQAQIDAVAAMQRQANAARDMATLASDTNSLVDSLQTQIEEVGRSEAELVRMRLAARGLRPEWLATVDALQTRLQAAQEAEAVRAKVEQLTAALQEQVATVGMSADEATRWQLAQQGATAEQIARVAALQQEAAAAKEAQQAQEDARNVERQRQEALTRSVESTRDSLREQIATWGMSADEAARAKLAAQGASEQQLAEVRQLQEELAELQRRKEALRATDVTVGASTAAEAYDAMQRARQRPAPPPPAAAAAPAAAETVPAVEAPVETAWEVSPPPEVPPIAAEIQAAWGQIDLPPIDVTVPAVEVSLEAVWGAMPAGPDVPIDVPRGLQTETPAIAGPDEGESSAIEILERIARGIGLLVEKEGLVVEEVRL